MVLPTDYHWALRGWLRTKQIKAGELAGTLVIRNLDGLLRLVGAERRLSPEERSLLRSCRARTGSNDDPVGVSLFVPDPTHTSGAQELLESVCEALGNAGLPAEPWSGLGVIQGDEVLDVCVQVTDSSHLYELMKSEGFNAEPDWDAEPFRDRRWPEVPSGTDERE